MIFIDTEACGLYSVPVLVQYAVDDGPIVLYDLWKEPINETINLIEWFAENDLCFFNAAFDWFMLYKIWTILSLVRDNHGGDIIPEDNIGLIASFEKQARDYPFCLRPKSVCDLMLHARKGKYQSLMRRKPITIRRVPTQLAKAVKDTLETSIPLDDVYFSKRKDPSSDRWVIKDIKKPNGDINPAFKNIELNFRPSMSLKTLAKYALGVKDNILLFGDIEVPRKVWPKEYGYAPFSNGKKGEWPSVIHHFINHWYYNQLARKYASDDVRYTRDLYKHLGCPESGDTDSELAAMVAVVRWRGFEINIESLKKLRDEEQKKLEEVPTAPNAVKRYLEEVMSDLERIVLNNGTKEEVLKNIAEWEENKVAAERAQGVIDARHATKEIELYDKLIKAEKFHASFKVIGALSSRMSGTDDLNAQGIRATEKVRSNFILKRPGYNLCRGDFDSFEVSIAAAVYDDDNLNKAILSGKSPHGLFACELFPEMSYTEIEKTKKTEDDKYNDGKTSFFRLMYGGGWEGLAEKIRVKPEIAEKAFNSFLKKYPGVGRHRAEINSDFCSMTQPGGLGTAVIWKDPAEYIDNGLGFKRYFTLENKICKELFELAQAPPKQWSFIKAKVTRRDRVQTAAGASKTAIYAAAFNIQAKNLRAAANHQIQSKGAVITKELQRRIWDCQPTGVHKWFVQPMNIHDEILCVTAPEIVEKVSTIVRGFVEEYKRIVPLLGIDWKTESNSWAD